MTEPSRSQQLLPIIDVAVRIGITPDLLELYGRTKAKVRTRDALATASGKRGKYILVTGVTPTPLGEGKTTLSVGLAQAMWHIGLRGIVNIRQPSQGPVFGVKGGGTGGGRSQVEPSDDINLHLTGDAHAVTSAHNLCTAFLENHLHRGNRLGFDLDAITWRRVLDVNDRALRQVETGLADKSGPARRSGFDITAASELMAILAMASDLADLRTRLGRIVLGFDRAGSPITADQLSVAGAMAAVMRDTIDPNLLQTVEGTPAFVHAGPYGNVATGTSSIVADRLALAFSDVVITEAGFGTDLGGEKFFNLKCRASGLQPDAAVLVCTVRALKAQSPGINIAAGKELDPALDSEDLDALNAGFPSLRRHIANVVRYGVPVVVAINVFPTDSSAEIDRIIEVAREAGADDAVVASVFADGGAGGVELAKAVMTAAERGSEFSSLYELDQPIETKIATIAREMYGAGEIEFLPAALEMLDRCYQAGFGELPICMAKTPYSFTGDARVKGAPEGFPLRISEIRVAAGAGFLTALVGDIQTMPGLGAHPAGEHIDLAPDGSIVGLV